MCENKTQKTACKRLGIQCMGEIDKELCEGHAVIKKKKECLFANFMPLHHTDYSQRSGGVVWDYSGPHQEQDVPLTQEDR